MFKCHCFVRAFELARSALLSENVSVFDYETFANDTQYQNELADFLDMDSAQAECLARRFCSSARPGDDTKLSDLGRALLNLIDEYSTS